MTETCTFIGGPKDGGDVPAVLWVLDNIEMSQLLDDGRVVIYFYELDLETKNYMYTGQRIEEGK